MPKESGHIKTNIYLKIRMAFMRKKDKYSNCQDVLNEFGIVKEINRKKNITEIKAANMKKRRLVIKQQILHCARLILYLGLDVKETQNFQIMPQEPYKSK